MMDTSPAIESVVTKKSDTPLIPGITPIFSLQRNGQTVTSDTPVKVSVTFQDMMYHAGGVTSCRRP